MVPTSLVGSTRPLRQPKLSRVCAILIGRYNAHNLSNASGHITHEPPRARDCFLFLIATRIFLSSTSVYKHVELRLRDTAHRLDPPMRVRSTRHLELLSGPEDPQQSFVRIESRGTAAFDTTFSMVGKTSGRAPTEGLMFWKGLASNTPVVRRESYLQGAGRLPFKSSGCTSA